MKILKWVGGIVVAVAIMAIVVMFYKGSAATMQLIDKAQATADQAQTAAGKAQATGEKAQATADQAQVRADSAWTKANLAQSGVAALDSRVRALESAAAKKDGELAKIQSELKDHGRRIKETERQTGLLWTATNGLRSVVASLRQADQWIDRQMGIESGGDPMMDLPLNP